MHQTQKNNSWCTSRGPHVLKLANGRQTHVLCGHTTFRKQLNCAHNYYGPYAYCSLDKGVAYTRRRRRGGGGGGCLKPHERCGHPGLQVTWVAYLCGCQNLLWLGCVLLGWSHSWTDVDHGRTAPSHGLWAQIGHQDRAFGTNLWRRLSDAVFMWCPGKVGARVAAGPKAGAGTGKGEG